MAWEMDKLTRVLMIEDHGAAAGPNRYRVASFMRVVRPGGENYLEPIPARVSLHRLADLYGFAAIEYVDPRSISRADTGGALGLTGMTSGVRESSLSGS